MYDREGGESAKTALQEMILTNSGHFFDLGSGELIANGTVKVKCDALPVAYTETGLEMSDGSHIDADVIVMATGYSGNMKDTACRIFGDKIGGSLEEFWQCDEEGESVSIEVASLRQLPQLTNVLIIERRLEVHWS